MSSAGSLESYKFKEGIMCLEFRKLKREYNVQCETSSRCLSKNRDNENIIMSVDHEVSGMGWARYMIVLVDAGDSEV